MTPGRARPAAVLAAALASDPGRPRLTWYDDVTGERIELSARVLANWVSKAGNLLQDDADAGPGTTVGLDLPPHWRALYWALAAWTVGATVVTGDDAAGADVLVTADPEAAAGHGGDAVLVNLAALARSHPRAAEAPAAVDEARELATHGDQLTVMADPDDEDLALVPAPASVAGGTPGNGTAYAGIVVPRVAWGETPRVALSASGELGAVLTDALAAWAADGSIVLVRADADAAEQAGPPERFTSEGVTVDAR